jgi:hypothetical protein
LSVLINDYNKIGCAVIASNAISAKSPLQNVKARAM